MYFEKLEKSLQGKEAIVVKGVRRSGKSSIIYKFVKELTKDPKGMH